jgi:hypothetical protein
MFDGSIPHRGERIAYYQERRCPMHLVNITTKEHASRADKDQ